MVVSHYVADLGKEAACLTPGGLGIEWVSSENPILKAVKTLSSTWEAKAGELGVWGQLGLHSETLAVFYLMIVHVSSLTMNNIHELMCYFLVEMVIWMWGKYFQTWAFL